MSYQHEIKARIYFHDTDAQGVVYHANYLDFAERGRAEFLRSRGHTYMSLFSDRGFAYVARHVEIEYFSSGRLDDEIRLVTYASNIGSTSFVMNTDAYLGDKLINRVKVTGVLLDMRNWKPIPIPDEIRATLE